MRVLLIIGSHMRHTYIFNKIKENFNIIGLILEEREDFVPIPPEGLLDIDRNNFINHFEKRRVAEEKYLFNQFTFSEINLPSLKTSYTDLNSQKTVQFVQNLQPDIAIVFGSGLIKDPLLSILPKYLINIHLGLSPYYKGSATLFWPFYNLEPQFAGSTIHLINEKIDAGEIISHVLPNMEYGDGIQDIGAKTVRESSIVILKILEYYKRHSNLKSYNQKKNGKLYLTTDFLSQHLRLIYQEFNDEIVNEYLDKKLSSRTPDIIVF